MAILNDLRAPAGVPHPKMGQSDQQCVWRREAQTILVTWQIVRRYEPMKPAFFATSVI